MIEANAVCIYREGGDLQCVVWEVVQSSVKEESEKAGLKLSIQKAKTVASSPITSWQIDGEMLETMTDFILGGSKITADGDCSHEIKMRLLLGRKLWPT